MNHDVGKLVFEFCFYKKTLNFNGSTKTLAEVCKAEAWTFVCRETSTTLTKGLIMPIRSSDHKPR